MRLKSKHMVAGVASLSLSLVLGVAVDYLTTPDLQKVDIGGEKTLGIITEGAGGFAVTFNAMTPPIVATYHYRRSRQGRPLFDDCTCAPIKWIGSGRSILEFSFR